MRFEGGKFEEVNWLYLSEYFMDFDDFLTEMLGIYRRLISQAVWTLILKFEKLMYLPTYALAKSRELRFS